MALREVNQGRCFLEQGEPLRTVQLCETWNNVIKLCANKVWYTLNKQGVEGSQPKEPINWFLARLLHDVSA
jgi:hypothetical protein